MIETIGEAHDLGWKLRVYCRASRREGLKSIRGCIAYIDVDLSTLVWTRGREFLVSRLGDRMKCVRCGSRQVSIALEPPPAAARQKARA
jgi:hypothetical protein